MQQERRRNRLILGFLALGLLAGAALMASSAQAASGPGPYLPPPAWDRKMPAATRFLILTNLNKEAVLDRETGLVWEQAPQTEPAPWYNARVVCTGKTTGDRKGWRLPSVHELASLVAHSSNILVLSIGHPFTNALGSLYWSATTTDPENISFAWSVDFSNGTVGSTGKSTNLHVWCVRGANNADQY